MVFAVTKEEHASFTPLDSPGPGTGFLAEAVAMRYLPAGSRWHGGLTPGYDLTTPDGLRVQVKSTGYSPKPFSPNGSAVPAVGYKFSPKGLPEEGKDLGSDVYLFVCTSGLKLKHDVSVEFEDGNYVVKSSSVFQEPRVFALASSELAKHFVRPYATRGDRSQLLPTLTNLWAPASSLQRLYPGDVISR